MFENKSNIIIASILLFLAALFWSGNFIVGKIAGLNEIPPISLNIKVVTGISNFTTFYLQRDD